MEQFGTLIIYIHCIGMYRNAVQATRKIVCRQHMTRTEAQAHCDEHARQARISDRERDYSYDWQPEREELTPVRGYSTVKLPREA